MNKKSKRKFPLAPLFPLQKGYNESVPASAPTSRRLEIDILRSAAIVGMVVYHFAGDLREFYSWNIPMGDPGWVFLQRWTCMTFLALVGISDTISRLRGPTERAYRKRNFQRSLRVFAYAMVITAVTYVWIPNLYIRFGILHCIAVSSLLLPYLATTTKRAILTGTLTVIIGMIMAGKGYGPLLLPLGMPSWGFRSVDYFPLFPWMSVVLFGAAAGRMLYESNPPPLRSTPLREALALPGKHALLIYMIHQPILLGVLKIILG